MTHVDILATCMTLMDWMGAGKKFTVSDTTHLPPMQHFLWL